MAYSRRMIAGILFFVAVTQSILGLTISEALYPDYNLSDNYLSDLGVGPSSIFFNSSIFLLGLLLLIGTYFLRDAPNFKTVNTLLLLMAIGAMGVGVFTEDSRIAHGASALLVFVPAGLSAIASYKALRRPLSLINVALGAVSLGLCHSIYAALSRVAP